MVRGLPAKPRLPMITLVALLGAGGIVLAFFPGSGESADNDATDFHGLGAFVAFFSGNVLAILIGRAHQLFGFTRGLGTALVWTGVLGLVSIPAYMAVLASGAHRGSPRALTALL